MKVEKYMVDGIRKKGGLLFTLIDPVDYKKPDDAIMVGEASCNGGADVILVGGSIGAQGELLDYVTKGIKEKTNIPVVLFPGNVGTITRYADALYFMSLLNSRNPYWISGAQTLASFTIKKMGIEPLPVGYVLVEPGGTAGWVGDVNLVPRDKPQIAAALALGGQYAGNRFIITDAGSGPKEGHIPIEMIREVASAIDVPYIVAGGVRTPEQARSIIRAGGDAIQVGTALQESRKVEKTVREMAKAIHEEGRKKV